VRIYAFGRDSSLPLEGSAGAAVSRIARIEGRTQVSAIHLAAGGEVARHAAPVPQLFLVVAGSGLVSGHDGEPFDIRPGRAAFWEAGEDHHCRSVDGLIALVVESQGLDPSVFMPLA
jgi:quercetin dioxygenase-like cupin family protein